MFLEPLASGPKPEVAALQELLVAVEQDPKFRLDHAPLVQIANPQHESGPPVHGCDDDRVAKDDVRARTREADEDESSHNRHHEDAAHDFDGGENVTVEVSRRHVAVAHGGNGLHAEKEGVEEGPGRPPGDALWIELVKGGEKKIERDVDDADKGGELWPGQPKEPLVGIAPMPFLGVEFDELDLSRTD